MTGPEHYREGERYAEASVYGYQRWASERGELDDLKSAQWQQAQAHLHFTAALAAAVALGSRDVPVYVYEAWRAAVQEHATESEAGS